MLLLMIAFVLAACDEADESTQQTAQEIEEQEVPSYNVVHRIRTYREIEPAQPEGDASEDGSEEAEGEQAPEPVERQFERTDGIPVGEEVVLIGDPFAATVDGTDVMLIKMRDEEDREVFVNSMFFVPNAELGVVIDPEAVAYSRPDVVNPTDRVLARNSFVAIDPDESENEFYWIVSWDHPAGRSFIDLYLREDDVSTDPDDVQAGLALFLSQYRDSVVAKRAMLESAEELGETAFVEQIRAELAVLRGDEPEEAMPSDLADIEIEAFETAGVISADGTLVYQFPQASEEYVITSLDQGAQVDVIQRTVEPNEVDGETGYWLKIQSPEGWVFSSQVEAEE
jgi:hypothetical protein